jgi:hypothetical protein
MGTGFLMGIDIFHGYGFGRAKPSGFVPVAISSEAATCMRKAPKDYNFGLIWLRRSDVTLSQRENDPLILMLVLG